MHQPVYTEPDSNVSLMPWTRLHAMKDYADMALWCEKTGFPATFNLVPCLLDQLEGYASGKISDNHLRLSSIPVADIDSNDRAFIIENFFAANEQWMIGRYRRYRELFQKRGPSGIMDSARMAGLFDNQEILDLTVLHNLAWFGENLLTDAEVAELAKKGHNFTEDDRRLILDKAKSWIGGIIPLYKRLWHEGLIELSVSPYYHPILPLLCRTESARDADPGTPLPREKMRNPEDARLQIVRAVKRFSEIFGKEPVGMWPSEGSVSEEILPLLKDTPIKWIATDEALLYKSLRLSAGRDIGRFGTTTLYRPHKTVRKEKTITIFFRDRRLSDRIGFDYANMPADEAVEEFVGQLRRIHDGLPSDGSNYLVPIILDGENAWEYFPKNGKEFLLTLYSRLLDDDHIRPTTLGGFIEKYPKAANLERLASGSWINGDFRTWVGVQEKNRGWEELIRTYQTFAGTASLLDEKTMALAHEELLIAEGSDWFWWFGEGNYTPHIEEFDLLFRERLKAVYKRLSLPPPESLDEPIHSGSPIRKPVRPPLELFTPQLDGRSTDYFEWSAAGLYEPSGFMGAMHGRSSSRKIERIFFGFDLEKLYIRIDTNQPARNMLVSIESIAVEFHGDRRLRVVLTPTMEGPIALFQEYNNELNSWHNVEGGISFAVDDVVEVAIPFRTIYAEPRTERQFFAYIFSADRVIERSPRSGYLTVEIPGSDFDAVQWTV